MTTISYQLYCSRNWPLTDTLAMLAEAGYAHVEGYRALFSDRPTLPDDLKAAGLTMPSMHYGVEDIEADTQGAIALSRAVGATAIYGPYLDEADRPTDRAGWELFAKRLAEAAKPLQDAGLTFGWHNHDFELVDLGGGETPLDVIVAAAPDLKLELDLGWVLRAGKDPVTMIKTYGSQIGAAHIKDVAPQGEKAEEDGWADVGTGVIDWPAVHAALQEAGVSHYVIEHDNPSDHHRFATTSLAAVQAF